MLVFHRRGVELRVLRLLFICGLEIGVVMLLVKKADRNTVRNRFGFLPASASSIG